MTTTITAQDLADRMLAEIHDDVEAGIIPAADVTSFADLHDYVDANEYGGAHELDNSTGLVNVAQNLVHHAIVAGALTCRTRFVNAKAITYGQTILVRSAGNRPAVPTTFVVEDVEIDPNTGTVCLEGYKSIPAGISQPDDMYVHPRAMLIVTVEG